MATVLHNQITVGTAAVQGPSSSVIGEVFLKAHPDNTGIVYVGVTGITAANGFPLSAGDPLVLNVSNLDDLYFIASAAAQKLAYIYYEL
jgi:hypothetical protein